MMMLETIQAEGDVNPRLLKALHDARDEIAALRVEVDKLCAPFTYGVYLAAHEDDTVDVLAHGRKVRVRLRPAIPAPSLRPGQEVIMNEALNVVAAAGWEMQGDVVALKERLDAERAKPSRSGYTVVSTTPPTARCSRILVTRVQCRPRWHTGASSIRSGYSAATSQSWRGPQLSAAAGSVK